MLPRTSFNSSPLIRLLADLDVGGASPSKQSFAEGLSLWLDWTDAISLSTALCAAPDASPAARPPEPEPGEPARGRAVRQEVSRVRNELTRAITSDALFSEAKASITRPAPPRLAQAVPAAPAAPAAPENHAPDFSPYRSRYLAHQRAMETRIGALRANVRAALSASSAELASLAALDAVLDKALAARERHLLSTVPVLLGRHFERSRRAAQETTTHATDPNPATQRASAARWPAAFGQQMQGVLLAELDFRWLPVQGMIEALLGDGKTATQTDTDAGLGTAAGTLAATQP